MIRFLTSILLLAAAAIAAAAQPTAAPAPAQEWGLVTVGCASLRGEPRHGAELETQATMGTPVLLDTLTCGEWRMVTMPDGYRAWMHTSAFVAMSDEEIREWRKSPRVIVTAPYGCTVTSDTIVPAAECAVTDATLGAIFRGTIVPRDFSECSTCSTAVELPDGRTGFLPTECVADFAQWSRRQMSVDTILTTARSLNGVTYLWGGTTPKALDCSGFTQVCFRNAGTLLPRNASAQAKIGDNVAVDKPEQWQAGDLLFFGADPDTTRITHVGIYLGNGRYIHCSGMVLTSSINPADPLFLARRVLAVRRINRGFSRIATHDWYF